MSSTLTTPATTKAMSRWRLPMSPVGAPTSLALRCLALCLARLQRLRGAPPPLSWPPMCLNASSISATCRWQTRMLSLSSSRPLWPPRTAQAWCLRLVRSAVLRSFATFVPAFWLLVVSPRGAIIELATSRRESIFEVYQSSRYPQACQGDTAFTTPSPQWSPSADDQPKRIIRAHLLKRCHS